MILNIGMLCGFTIKFAFCVLIFSNVLDLWAYGLSESHSLQKCNGGAGFYIPRIVGGVVLGFLWRFIITELFPVIVERPLESAGSPRAGSRRKPLPSGRW